MLANIIGWGGGQKRRDRVESLPLTTKTVLSSLITVHTFLIGPYQLKIMFKTGPLNICKISKCNKKILLRTEHGFEL